MKLFYTTTLLTFLSIFVFSPIYGQNNININTIASNLSSEPAWLTKVNQRMAWIQQVNNENEVFLHENGVTTMVSTPDTFAIPKIQMSQTQIAWPADSPNFTSGSCQNGTPQGFHYSNGGLMVDNVSCVDYIASNGINIIRIYFDFNTFTRIAEILDPDFNVIFTFPSSYQGQSLSMSNIATYGGDHVFIKGFINAEEVIFYYNVKTGEFVDIFQTDVFIAFATYNNNEEIAFTVDDFTTNQTDLYYYDGNSTSLIASDVTIPNSTLFTFQDRVVWVSGDDIMQYQNGITSTISTGNISLNSVNVSACYLTWAENDFNANTSILNLYDGASIQTINFNGVLNSSWKAQIDNDCMAFVLLDLSTNTYSINRADFATSCCTGEDIVTNDNDDEFSNTFIESNTVFTCNTSPVYQALDYIELTAGFTVPADYTFCAEIENACILYQE